MWDIAVIWTALFSEHPNLDPYDILPDGRFNHVAQVQDRLSFLRFLLKDGQLWLCESLARQVGTWSLVMSVI